MNVYFYNPCYLSVDKFPIFAEILKVKRVIDLTEPNTRNNELVKHYQPMAIYIRQDSDIEQSIRDAVYKFNEPICKPKIEKGKFTGEFIVNDLYKSSNAFNPIYNLEIYDDDNTLVLYKDNKSKNICKNFTEHSLNILKKHVGNNIYENRICFCWIDCLFNNASLFFKHNFYSLRNKIDPTINSQTNYYNPLLSYIDFKLKLSVINNKISNIFHFFLSEQGIKQMNLLFEKKYRQLFHKYSDDDCIYSDYDDDRDDIESDLDYISSNGGDWIFD
jgi:hypothetical protein